jgi:glycerol-3-phosphate acyltransferase PlsX
VTDGFAGNVLVKSTEGACLELMKLLKSAMLKNTKTKIGALFLKKEVMELKNKMDYNNYGGAVLLGGAKTIVKGHGSSKATAVFHCIEQAYEMENNDIRSAIGQAVNQAE